jgi:hypothetical protein
MAQTVREKIPAYYVFTMGIVTVAHEYLSIFVQERVPTVPSRFKVQLDELYPMVTLDFP